MECPKCGCLTEDEFKFCPKCGNLLIDEARTQLPSNTSEPVNETTAVEQKEKEIEPILAPKRREINGEGSYQFVWEGGVLKHIRNFKTLSTIDLRTITKILYCTSTKSNDIGYFAICTEERPGSPFYRLVTPINDRTYFCPAPSTAAAVIPLFNNPIHQYFINDLDCALRVSPIYERLFLYKTMKFDPKDNADPNPKGIVRCKRCASNNITLGKKGFSAGKAAVGIMVGRNRWSSSRRFRNE